VAYGVKVLNVDNRVILDSSENRPILIKARPSGIGTANVSSSPNTNLSGGPTFAGLGNLSPALSFNDLIFVRRTASGFVSEDGGYSTSGRAIYASGGGSLTWFEAKALSASSISNHDSGYGLNVYDGSGTAAANLLFSTNAGNSLEVVAIGTFALPGSAHYIDVPIVDQTVPHYILITGTFRFRFVQPAITEIGQQASDIEQFRGYEYIYSSSNLTKIRIWNAIIDRGRAYQSSDSYTAAPDVQAAYVIVKLRS